MAALALAHSGDAGEAVKFAPPLSAEFQSSTLVQNYWLPAIHAEVELYAGNYSRAIELLRAAGRYELADTPSPLTPVYIRAEALLRARQPAAAAAEFQRTLERGGIVSNFPIGALAHLAAKLGLARAYTVSGEVAKAQSHHHRLRLSNYQDFFELWKGSDTDIPLLNQAKAEYLKIV